MAWVPTRFRNLPTIAVWLGAIAVFALTLTQHLGSLPHGRRGWDDAYVYLGAASNFISHPSHLFDAARLQVSSAGPQRAFLVPPSGMLPFLPLVPVVRLAGINAATAVWSFVDTGALVAALILIGRRVGLGWLTLGAAMVVIGLSKPLHWEVFSAQLNGVVLLMLALSLLTFPRARSGVLMGLALAVKPTALVVLLVPLFRARGRLTLLALLALAVTNVVFVPFIGLSATLFYVGSVLPYMLGYVMHDPSNISLANVLQTWLGGGQLPRRGAFGVSVPHGLAALVVLWAVRLAVFAAWVRIAIERRMDVAAAFCLAIAMVPIFTATVWPHYLVYVLPLALLTLRAPFAWARAAAALSLFAMLWSGRADGLWVSLLLLLPAAMISLLLQSGWRPALPGWSSGPLRIRTNG